MTPNIKVRRTVKTQERGSCEISLYDLAHILRNQGADIPTDVKLDVYTNAHDDRDTADAIQITWTRTTEVEE